MGAFDPWANIGLGSCECCTTHYVSSATTGMLLSTVVTCLRPMARTSMKLAWWYPQPDGAMDGNRHRGRAGWDRWADGTSRTHLLVWDLPHQHRHDANSLLRSCPTPRALTSTLAWLRWPSTRSTSLTCRPALPGPSSNSVCTWGRLSSVTPWFLKRIEFFGSRSSEADLSFCSRICTIGGAIYRGFYIGS
jgi:hypothetical protein